MNCKWVDCEEDSPALEAELLKAANGPFTPYSSEEMRAACEQVLREKRNVICLPQTAAD
jgi:hypothetical protein